MLECGQHRITALLPSPHPLNPRVGQQGQRTGAAIIRVQGNNHALYRLTGQQLGEAVLENTFTGHLEVLLGHGAGHPATHASGRQYGPAAYAATIHSLSSVAAGAGWTAAPGFLSTKW